MTNQQKENILRGIVVGSYLESSDKTEILAYIDFLKEKKQDNQTFKNCNPCDFGGKV